MELYSVNDKYIILSQLFSYQERKVEEDQPTLKLLMAVLSGEGSC